MKSSRHFASFAIAALVLSTLVLSATMFAKDSNSGTFTLSDTARIGSTNLAPGTYKAEWSGSANDVKINILDHGKTVATAEGQLQDLNHPAPYSAVTLKVLSDNSKAVDTIQFNNRSESLKLND
jgi:hypothetical protein